MKLFHTLKHDFVPHKGNNHKPHFLRSEAMFTTLLLMMVVELLFLGQILFVFNKTGLLANILPGVLTLLTNEDRAQNNAGALTENLLLTQAAQIKANDMAARGYFSHVNPDGQQPWYYFDMVGYKYKYAGENLAVNFFESEDVARAWMNSPTHRANIVNQNFTEIGIGVANGVYQGRNTVFVAQLFGTPLSIPKVAIASTPQNVTATPTPVPKPEPENVLGEATVTTATTKQVVKQEAKETIKTAVVTEVEKAVASPRKSAAYVYGGVAVLTLFSLMLIMFVRSELRHPFVMMRGLVMVSVVVALFLVNVKYFNDSVIVPIDSTFASTVAE